VGPVAALRHPIGDGAQINSQVPLGNDLNHDQPEQAINHPQK
jgi:hypothetical protein